MPDEKKVCSKCGGTGRIEVDDLTVRQCICAFARAMKEHLGAEIALAPSITSSPLFEMGGVDKDPKTDLTSKNLFLKGAWEDLLPHLKCALVGKGLFFSFKVLTDERLKIVYVGDESYKARSKSKRDESPTFNSLTDILGPDVDLVILRIGKLGYPNKAMPGILKEALMLREAASKATWINETPDSFFGPGHFSYDENVAEYIEKRFAIMDLTNKNRTKEAPQGCYIPSEPVDVDMNSPPQAQIVTEKAWESAPKPRFESRPSSANSDGALGDGGGGYKPKYKPKKYGDNGGGGGPLG